MNKFRRQLKFGQLISIIIIIVGPLAFASSLRWDGPSVLASQAIAVSFGSFLACIYYLALSNTIVKGIDNSDFSRLHPVRILVFFFFSSMLSYFGGNITQIGVDCFGDCAGNSPYTIYIIEIATVLWIMVGYWLFSTTRNLKKNQLPTGSNSL